MENGSVVETLAQDWPPLDRKMQRGQNGHSEICAKALRCRGLQWWRWRQLHWKEVEKDKWAGPHPKRFKIYRWEDMVSTEVSKVCGNADGFAESVQQPTWRLHFAWDRGEWRQFAKLGKKPDLDVVIVKTQWGCTSRHRVQAHPPNCGNKSTGGFEWRRMAVVAPSGVEWWIQVVQGETENDEMERE